MAEMEHDEKAVEQTYRAIGRFFFEFSQCEFALRSYLADEVGLADEYFSAVIESYDAGMLCNVAIAVVKKSRAPSNSARLIRLIENFRDMSTHRNVIAHGLWVPHIEGGTVHGLNRRRLTSKPEANRAVALEKFADQLNDLRAKLTDAFLNAPLE
jgi:hypothetical protein